MSTKLQQKILSNLLNNPDYNAHVLKHLKPELFTDEYRTVFSLIADFQTKYNAIPNKDAITLMYEGDESRHTNLVAVADILNNLEATPEVNLNWLNDATEKWVSDQSLFNSITRAVNILSGSDKTTSRDSIPDMIREALSISFDDTVGHDYMEDGDDRFQYYSSDIARIPFDLDFLNQITDGGVPLKTLNMLLAGTNVGKTLMLCHLAAGYMTMGKNVLYITLEVREEEIARRIDSNLMNVRMCDLRHIGKDLFNSRLNSIRSKSQGSLFIKEFPTAGANMHHVRSTVDDISIKKQKKVDIVILDYLNLAASTRVRGLGNGINTYHLVKAVAEEFRGLAVEKDFVAWSATQTTRSGFTSSDVDLTDTSESFGVPQTADFMLAMMSNDTLRSQGQYLVKQLKTRYKAILPNEHKFLIGVDYDHQRLFELDDNRAGLTPEDNESPEPQYTPPQRGRGGITNFNAIR